MQIPLRQLANGLRVLGLLWLVGWTLYVTFGDHSFALSVGDLTTILGTLLIPAALAFAVSWWLDRVHTRARDEDATRDDRER